MIQTFVAAVVVGAVSLLAADPAYAQRAMYRCTTDGRTHLSDRPCEGRPAASLASIGPTRGRPPGESPTQAVAKASEILDYLSPECAELREGLRNGPARGLGPRAFSELSASYRQRCGEEEQKAQLRLNEDRTRKRDLRDREVAAENAERDRARLTREQCEEMYRIVHGKRQKIATMTPGERADFDRFEANRQARCRAG